MQIFKLQLHFKLQINEIFLFLKINAEAKIIWFFTCSQYVGCADIWTLSKIKLFYMKILQIPFIAII